MSEQEALEFLTPAELLQSNPILGPEEIKDTRTFEEKISHVRGFLAKFTEGNNESLRTNANAICTYLEQMGYLEGRETLSINLFHLFNRLDEHLAEGDMVELPWDFDEAKSSAVMHHLYAKSNCIRNLPAGVRVIDSSGSYFGALFNNEDVVVVSDEGEGWASEIKFSLIDLKMSVYQLKFKKPTEHEESIKARFGGVVEVSYIAQQYDRPRTMITVEADYIPNKDGRGKVERKIPDEMRMAMEYGEIFTDDLRQDVIAGDYVKKALVSRVIKAMEDHKSEPALKLGLSDLNVVRNVSMGDGSDSERAWVLREMEKQPKYKAYVNICRKVARYLEARVMQGMSVPDANLTGDAIDEFGQTIKDGYLPQNNHPSLGAFFWRVGTQVLGPEDMLVITNINSPEATTTIVSRARFHGGIIPNNLGFDVCAYLVGDPVLRDSKDKADHEPRAAGSHRSRAGVIRLGVSRRCPKPLRDLMEREGRSKYGEASQTTEWPEYTFDGEGGLESLMTWFGKMEDIVIRLGRRQRPTVPSRTQNVCNILEMNDDKAVLPQFSQKFATNVLSEASTTIGCQMLDLQVWLAQQAAVAATRKSASGGDSVTVAVSKNHRVMVVSRVVAPLVKFTGTSQYVLVGGPTEYLGGSYEDRDPRYNDNRRLCSRSVALFVGKGELKHLSHVTARIMTHVVSHHMNRAAASDVTVTHNVPNLDYAMVGHISVASINPTRNFSVAVSVTRWLTQIMSGLSGSASDIAKKADTGVFMTQLQAYTVLQALLRCGAVSLMRDAKDYAVLFPVAVDGTRAIRMAPVFTSGRVKQPNEMPPNVNLVQQIGDWYICEMFTGRSGNLAAAQVNSMDLVFAILKEYRLPATQRNLAGVGQCAYDLWMKHQKSSPGRRRAAILHELKDQEMRKKFWDDEVLWVHYINDAADTNGANSVLAMVEQGMRSQIPKYIWSQALQDTAHTSVSSILTDKRGLERHDGPKGREGFTVSAAKAFLPGLLPDAKEITQEILLDRLSSPGANRSGSVLACGLRALMDGRKGTNAIVNKADSVEKDRCIAIMDWIMRYPTLLIEEVFTKILKGNSGDKESLNTVRNVPQSLLTVKDKAKALAGTLDALQAEVRDASKREYNPNGLVYSSKRGKKSKIIRVMNDASRWGPGKNLAGMYITALAKGASRPFLVVLRATMELYMTKQMVLHSSMLPPTEARRKGPKDRRKHETLIATTEAATNAWNAKVRRFL